MAKEPVRQPDTAKGVVEDETEQLQRAADAVLQQGKAAAEAATSAAGPAPSVALADADCAPEERAHLETERRRLHQADAANGTASDSGAAAPVAPRWTAVAQGLQQTPKKKRSPGKRK